MINKLKSKGNDKLSKGQVYDVIRDMLQAEKELTIRKMISDETFDSPAWAEKQAYFLGFIKSLDKLLNFIPDKEVIK